MPVDSVYVFGSPHWPNWEILIRSLYRADVTYGPLTLLAGSGPGDNLHIRVATMLNWNFVPFAADTALDHNPSIVLGFWDPDQDDETANTLARALALDYTTVAYVGAVNPTRLGTRQLNDNELLAPLVASYRASAGTN